MNERKAVRDIYRWLLRKYGQQGWWPVEGVGYHKGDYTFPRNGKERFEICAGAILAQNTAWKNAARAVANLKNANRLDAKKIAGMSLKKISVLVKPAGYFNQKARKLKGFANFYLGLRGKIPAMEELLPIWGIGPETADSILLYAYGQPSFVVDAYTKRIFSNLGLVRENAGYEEVRAFFERNLRRDAAIYQEYHALIVEHAKRHYSKKADRKPGRAYGRIPSAARNHGWGKCPLRKNFGKRAARLKACKIL